MAGLNSIPSPTGGPEPAVYGTLLLALLTLAVSFGLSLSPGQVGSISALVSILAGLVIRHHVVPAVPAP